MLRQELEPCPFCGSKSLYEMYAMFNMFPVPVILCDHCKSVFTVEGVEDRVTGDNDGFMELREAWNNRISHACYADEVTNRNCKYSVNRGWCENTCKIKMRTCSKCNHEINNKAYFVKVDLDDDCYTYESRAANYCPNCGAKVLND